MKSISNVTARFGVIILGMITSIISLAQEKSAEVNVDINKGGGSHWYASPWVWIVGAAVFILLLVALLRGSGSRE